MRSLARVFLPLAAGVLLLLPGAARPDRHEPGARGTRSHRVYFEDTDNELNVYHIRGREEGPTLLIIGGIHGDEPGGYLAADLYADLTLRRGDLIVIPRANVYSIHRDERGTRGDMNRKFGADHDHELDGQIIGVLKEIMRQADALLNLHDGSGFYRPRWVDVMHNPLRWGQSVIIDTDRLRTASGEVVYMQRLAESVVERANRSIREESHRFRVKNTRTWEPNTDYKEQRGSATFYAVDEVGIPAFGVETSKEIGEESLRVEYQIEVINGFLDAMGIVPDHPRFALEPPVLRYLTVRVDGAHPVVVEDGHSLAVRPGAEVAIAHVEANYERGLVVDVEGTGSFNDLGRPFTLERDARVTVRKDKYPCGGIRLVADPAAEVPVPPASSPAGGAESGLLAFRVRVNGEERLLAPGGRLVVLRGDELELEDPVGPGLERDCNLNFRGFVGNQVENDAEDRGYVIHTAHDLLQRFSLRPDGELYEIRAERGQEILAVAEVEVEAPRMRYLMIRAGEGPRVALAPGDTLRVRPRVPLVVEELVSEPDGAEGFIVNVRGFAGPEGAEDRGHPFLPGRDLLPRFSLGGEGRVYEILTARLEVGTGRAFLVVDPDPPRTP
ncbi:MAG: M14/M99 family metallopeptidase [bacterium]